MAAVRSRQPGTDRRQKEAGLTARPVDLDGLVGLDEGVRTLLANTVLSAERHSVSDREGLAEERRPHANQRKYLKKEKREERIR